MAVQFRAATSDDAGTLRALAEIIWREYYPAIISAAQIEYMLETMYGRAAIRSEIARGVVWELVSILEGSGTAGERSSPVGYLSYTHDETSQTITLHKLYVLPRLHGQGIGRAMIERVKAAAGRGGARTIRLQVNKRNTRAIDLYQRAGFRIADAIVCDIGGGFVMDDYVLTLDQGAQGRQGG